MILYVKSDIEPKYEAWTWWGNEKVFSLRGIEKCFNLFDELETVNKKLKFKFIKNKFGLLIDFEDKLHKYSEYHLYLGSEIYCTFTVENFRNVNAILEHECSYFILKYAVENIELRYHNTGFYDQFTTHVFIGLADVVNDSFTGVPFKTNLSFTKKHRNYYGMLFNENKREKTLLLTNCVKNKSDYREIEFVKPIIFSYFAVTVNIESTLKNKRYKLKLL